MNKQVTLMALFLVGILVACSGPLPEEINTFSPRPVETDGSYIVVFKKPQQVGAFSIHATQMESLRAVRGLMLSLEEEHELPQPLRVFSVALQGGQYRLTEEQAEELAQDPSVAYVEKNQVIHVSSVQSNPPWGLDRIDQANLPLDRSYTSSASAAAVHAYVIDTGILTTHTEFQGRASSAIDIVGKDSDATDCNGHGTHVAGTIGSATFGVAKEVQLHAVRVLDCNGSGTYADVIAGIEWVTAHHQSPAVANMSLGGPVSQAVDDAIRASIQSGVTFVVAAGNENTSACNSSPSRVSSAITVGSITNRDARSSFSNYGSCVSVFAPGSDILSTWFNSNTATNTISGTSMASPHVAGVVALYLAQHPQAAPADVKAAVVSGAVVGKVTDPGTGSPNRLVNTAFISAAEPPPPPPPAETVLVNHVPVSGLSGPQGSEKFFVLQVPAGATGLTFNMSGGTGDADIYVKRGERPTATSFDCRPYSGGNNESCPVTTPAEGSYFVMIRGYAAYSGASVVANYQVGSGGGTDPCTACNHEVGSLAGKGSFIYHPNGAVSYTAAAGAQKFWLKGPSGTDFDLYLYKKNGSSFVQVASSVSLTSEEFISYSGTAGEYQLKVISYSGSGKYDLWSQTP